MNSNFLTGNYKNIYKSFFDKYDLVFSTPISFPIVGDTSFYGKGNGCSISQKLPLRNYIGINLGKKLNEIEFIYKEGVNNDFRHGNIENFYKIDKELLKNIGLDYEIGFLSEYNWNDPTSYISNILFSILIINNEISIGEINDIDIIKENNQYILKKIFSLDEELLKRHNFFSNIRNNSSFLGGSIIKSNSHLLTILKDNEHYFKSLGKNIDYNNLDLTISLISTNSFIKNNYNSKYIIESENDLKKFKNGIGYDFLEIGLIETLDELSKFYSLKVFKELNMLYNNTAYGNNFFLDVQAYRKVLKSIFKSFGGNFIDIKKLREIMISYIPFNNLNIFIDQVGVGGESKLLVLSNKSGLLDEELLLKINQSIGLNMTLDYSSYFDGYERQGIKLEQYKKKEICSKFSTGVKVIKYIKGEIKEEFIDRYEIIQTKNVLIMSKNEKDIIYNGSSINSKELKSQSYTIDLFEKLFLSLKIELSSKDMNLSSYSKNKNEFIGKILLPLKKLYKIKLGKNIEIDCYGKIDDFNIRLIGSEIDIYLICN